MMDLYEVRARLVPALLASLPPAALAAVALGKISVGSTVGALFAPALFVLIASKVRDWGRALEPDLFAAWGAIPTTRLLRWADADDATDMAERHQRISQATDIGLPDRAAESADPAAADQTYLRAVMALRNKTGEGFPVLAGENREYGFRRNTLAVKPVAVGIAAASVLLGPILWIATNRPAFMLGAAVGLLVLPFWLWRANDRWVRIAAERYAQRLISAGESLPPHNS